MNPERSDDWRMGHFGFRSDWHASSRDTLTVQGDGYIGEVGQLAPSVTIAGRPEPEGDLEIDEGGGNFLTRWRHEIHPGSELDVRAYYDRTDRDDPTFNDSLDTADFEVQHKFDLTPEQQIIWGADYRNTWNRNKGKGLFVVEPSSATYGLVSAFVQDQITFFDTLHVTLGTKLEHNDFSGFEVQPGIRAAWDLLPKQTLWSAISRAVRVPTRLERDVAIDVTDSNADPLARLLGNKDFDSVELIAYELGYRWQILESLAIDLATFYNDYKGLGSLELGDPIVDPENGRTIFPITNQNLTDGYSKGIEALVSYSPLPYWRLTGIYSYLDLSLNPHGTDLNHGALLEGATPHNQFALRSSFDLPAGVQLDAQFREVSAVRSMPEVATGEGIPEYAELDVRLAWQVRDTLELSVVGQNLLHEHHPEFGSPAARGEIERGVLGRAVFRF